MARRHHRPQQKQQQRPSSDNKEEQKVSNGVDAQTTTPDKAHEPDSGSNDKPGRNDPAWYARNEYLLRDVGSYSFAYAYGVAHALGFGLPAAYAAKLTQGYASPFSVVSLRTKPTLGFSDSKESPLNVSAASIYGFVRSKNAGRKNYDPADLFLYLTAIANLYSFIVWAERIYSFMMTYSDQNRYIPVSLVTLNGVDFDNMLVNLANYRAWLNMLIDKVSVFAVPSDITYFNKVTFMYRNIYIENAEGNIKDQIYQYIPDGFYRFRLDADNIGMLDYVRLPGSMTAQDIINFGNTLLSDLFEDEDASLISGDLFKVYGDTILRIPSLDEFVVLPLVYDPMVLWQMKNSVIVNVMRRSITENEVTTASDVRKTGNSHYSLGAGRTQPGFPGCVFQGLDGLLYSVERAIDDSASSASNYECSLAKSVEIATTKALSSELPHPDAGVVIESSRNIVGPHVKPSTAVSSDNDLGYISCGTYIVVDVSSTQKTARNMISNYNISGSAILSQAISGVSHIPSLNSEVFATCRYHPQMLIYTNDSGVAKNIHYLVDLNNFTLLGQEQIDKLHDVALLSLFYVPGIAKV